MLAVILFGIFGAMMAVVGGIISSGTELHKQVMIQRKEATRAFFEQSADVFNNRITAQEMQIPPQTTCDGITYSVADPRPYLCMPEIRQLFSWEVGANNITDAWRQPITGIVARQTVAVGPNAQAPVTAMALVSGGPNGVVEPQLQSAINTLRPFAEAGLATIPQVLRLSIASDSALTGSDDIIYTFTNQNVQRERWETISYNLGQIKLGMQQSYMKQLADFSAGIAAYYVANPSDIIIPYSWKQSTLGNKPSVGVPNITTDAGRKDLGLDEAFDVIVKTPATGGSGLSISSTVGTSNAAWPTANDVLTLTVTNAFSSPWTVNYSTVLRMTDDPN